jgi:type II secretory pathway pseudopilin PulG
VKLLRTRRFVSGLTLIEILVAMMIGLMIIAGIGYVYLQGREGNRIQDDQTRLQEDTRLVVETLSREFRNARFMGCKFPLDEDPTSLGAGQFNSISISGIHPWFTEAAATGVDNSRVWLMKDAGSGANGLRGVINSAFLFRGFDDGVGWPRTTALTARLKASTDVLMFMRVSDEQRKVVGAVKGATEFEISGDPLPGVRTNGRLANLVVSSCQSGAEVVKATVRDGGLKFSIDNTFNLTSVDSNTGAVSAGLMRDVHQDSALVGRFEPVAYYIARDTSNRSRLPALYRVGIADMLTAADEATGTGVWDTNGGDLIAAGVDDLQLRYLVDGQYLTATQVDALGNPNVYWPRVRAIEVTVTLISENEKARSQSESQTLLSGATVSDQRLRQEVRFIVNLFNP